MVMIANTSRKLLADVVVTSNMIDFNRHLSDIGYHSLFSRAEVAFFEKVEINDEYRAETKCTVYTAESHATFLKEVLEGDRIDISFQILDLSNKAVHVLMELRNSASQVCAYHECMLLHVKKAPEGPRSYPFGRYQLANLVHIFSKDKDLPRPTGAGRRIAIRRSAEGITSTEET
ncbi:thioesterase family protein [Rhizobium sp. 16-449-1b]|uniref:thioesterase family protein n=1 Tax=Rhizobium sp. 16-449-1b TaxID=2819989 RepID=UPI001ADBB445|nr:thioesterase family protein [Rhizobium sp. 16-449-1b]MBO9195410.1 thioesterase family protein [Rhizobium sp. 16-449-1b]